MRGLGGSGDGLGVAEELDWHWFDAFWGGVFVAPGSVKLGEAGIEGAELVGAWVGQSQAGERLRNVKDGVRNCVSADRVATFGDFAAAVSAGEDE